MSALSENALGVCMCVGGGGGVCDPLTKKQIEKGFQMF